jgi:RNA polymerase sigma factor (sigma-70 family)
MNSVIMDETDFVGSKHLDSVFEIGHEGGEGSWTLKDDAHLQAEIGANGAETSSAVTIFIAHRSLLFGIAYRMLGQTADAEDMIHEVWLRWRNQDTSRVRSAKAWLGCTMRRLCIDQLRSARRQREQPYGLVAPEPSIALDEGSDDHQNKGHSLAAACAILLRTLRPMERAVFVLREVFGYGYSETAAIIGKSDANCRQIACRAKTELGRSAQVQLEPDLRAYRLAEAFLSVAATGHLCSFLELLKDSAPNKGSCANACQGCRKTKFKTTPRWPIRSAFPLQHSPRPGCSFATPSHRNESLHGWNPLERLPGQPMHEDIA